MSTIEITFIEPGGKSHVIRTSPAGTLMELARAHELPGIEAICAGSCICGTCHVYVAEAWHERLPPIGAEERELIEGALEPRPTSRLSCQIVLTPELDGLVVYLPKPPY